MTGVEAGQVGAVLFAALPNDHAARLRMIETFFDCDVVTDDTMQRLLAWSTGLELGPSDAPTTVPS